MFTKTTQLLSLTAALISTAAAVPSNVVATEIPGCAGYPSTSSGNPFLVSLKDSGNSSIEGYGDTSNYVRGQSSIRFTYITFPTNNQVAKNGLDCTNNTLHGYLETGVSGYSWVPLQISPYPYDATLGYDFGSDATLVKAFTHTIDGVQQDGVFLGGYDNTTTWGVRYETDGAYGQDFFYIRLLGPNSADPSTGAALYPGEFTSFIKVGS